MYTILLWCTTLQLNQWKEQHYYRLWSKYHQKKLFWILRFVYNPLFISDSSLWTRYLSRVNQTRSFPKNHKNTSFPSESCSRIAIIVFLENELTSFSSNKSCLFFFWLSNTLWYFKSTRFTFRSVMHTALKVLIPVLLVFAVVSTVRTVSAQENTKSFMAGGVQSDEVSESVANVWISPSNHYFWTFAISILSSSLLPLRMSALREWMSSSLNSHPFLSESKLLLELCIMSRLMLAITDSTNSRCMFPLLCMQEMLFNVLVGPSLGKS